MSAQEKYGVANIEMVNGVPTPMSSKKIFDVVDYYGAIGLKTLSFSTYTTAQFGTYRYNLVFDVNINYGEYKMSANATEAEQSEANDAEQPAAKKTAPKKKAAVKRKPAKKPAKKEKATSKKTAEELVDTMKEIITVQLGVYGTISDELSARLEKIRAEAPKKRRELEKRGEKVQKDLKKAQKDLKKKLKNAQKDLKKYFEKTQKNIKKKVQDIAP